MSDELFAPFEKLAPHYGAHPRGDLVQCCEQRLGHGQHQRVLGGTREDVVKLDVEAHALLPIPGFHGCLG